MQLDQSSNIAISSVMQETFVQVEKQKISPLSK